MVLGLTRAQIIAQGLALAGRPDLTSDARLWLSMFLEDMYLNQDFEWLLRLETAIAVADGTSVPADYRASKSAIIYAPNGSPSPITALTKNDEIDSKKLELAGSTGQPLYFYVDQYHRKLYFLPQPDQAYTMDLRYYFVPEIGDFDSDFCDDDVPTWQLPFSILVDHVKARAMEYNDDQRQEGAATGVRNKIMESKTNNHDRRAGPSRMQLGKRFKKRF